MTSVWKLVKKEKLSANTSKFYFSSKCCVVKNNVNGVEWFGRHFTVKIIIFIQYY